MKNTYAIEKDGDRFIVTKNGRAIIRASTRTPLHFATAAAAQTFIAINVRADARHGAR